MNSLCFLTFLIYSLSIFVIISGAVDTINTNRVIRDGDTILSSKQIFELGFFSLGSSANRYLGIWYKNIQVMTPIWVANRESPLRNSTSGVLIVNQSGQLVILDESNNNTTIWYSNISTVVQNPIAQLLDSGNLVIREANDDNLENYLWQSFDYPTDTLLPGMSIRWSHVTGTGSYLSSWRTIEDPTPGGFTIGFDNSTGYTRVVIKGGGAIQYRLGEWDGIQFNARQRPILTAGSLVNNDSVLYYREEDIDPSVSSRFTLGPIGVAQRWKWVSNRSNEWVFSYAFPADMCDSYKICGPYGICNSEKNPVCACLSKFVPRDKEGWVRSGWSGGCVRRTPLKCNDDVFLRYSGIKIPDSRVTRFNGNLSLEECEAVCLRNCSCMGYMNMSGCMLWYEDLVDFRRIQGARQDIYIRMAASVLDSDGTKRKALIAILTSVAGIVLLGMSLALFIWKRKMNDRKLRKQREVEENNEEELELPLYDLSTVIKATDSFSTSNKLGEGGYGPVYKGMLEDGKEIAVKRLSEFSSQGAVEFKNEVVCIAKLQHRNLVKLIGCCIQGDEKMLIYEYMINLSLDLILFDKTKSKQLDWQKRFHIINGIARGLLYLHQDSRLRIIHRDLKASNVLLDNDLNPKIADFGLARIFGGNETEANTKRVVGTYGYMSPEYAGEGLFSLKSDIYSFGVLLLETVSGQRNRGFNHMDHHHNLLGHAWILYKDGKSLELVDPNIIETVCLNELLRSIHVALLCVQHCPEDRPSMSCVVLMLASGSVLPEARQPGFFSERGYGSEKTTSMTRSSDGHTITQLDAR